MLPARAGSRQADGMRLAPVVLCDIDGTLNDERRPEGERLATVGPARAALAPLAAMGVPVVLVTARSPSEARRYAAAVGASQVAVVEDGAALSAAGRDRPLGPAPLDAIRALLAEVRSAVGDRLPASCDPPGTWTRGDATEILRASAGRVASAVVPGASPAARQALARLAPSRGLRAFGETVNLVPAVADKGTALGYLHAHAGALLGRDVGGVLPLAFGNGPNDLPMFLAAHELGGLAALVHDAEAPLDWLPNLPWLHRLARPHGHGVALGLERLLPDLVSIARRR